MQRLTLVIIAGCFVAAGVAQAGESRQTNRASAVSFRLATTTATAGFDRVVYNGKQLFVSPSPSFTSGEIRSVEAADAGTSLQVVLTRSAASNLVSASSRAQTDRLAVFVGSRIVAAPTWETAEADGSTLIGGLSSEQANRLIALLSREGVAFGGAVITATSPVAAIRAGDTFTVDTFVSGVADLGAFEIALDAADGTTGRIVIEDVEIVDTRSDFVFDPSAVTAEDKTQFRAVGAMMQGGVNAEEPAYLATYTLRASDDASGSFAINVRTEGGALLRDSDALAISYRAGKDLIITVGKINARERYSR